MKEVFFVKSENRSKVEELLKSDDKISRGSITAKEASSLELGDEGYFIIIDCDEESIEKAKELVKDFAEVSDDKEKVIEKVKEQEDSAMQGFGNILG